MGLGRMGGRRVLPRWGRGATTACVRSASLTRLTRDTGCPCVAGWRTLVTWGGRPCGSGCSPSTMPSVRPTWLGRWWSAAAARGRSAAAKST